MINKRKIKCNDNDNDDNNEIKVATRQNNASLTFYMFNICLLFDTSPIITFPCCMQLNTLV